MSATKNFSEFTNKYPLTKTLRFELKPVGKTIETMHKWAEELRHESEKVPSENNLLFQDEVRSADYKKVKKLIDEKHKHFIDDALNEFSFLKEDLYTFQTFYFKTDKTSDESDAFDELKSKMRKAIGACFKKKNVKELENKKLITDLLPNFINTHWDEPMAIRLKEHGIENKDQALELIEKFKYFTTYFTGFHQNRQNMYADEEKSTAIAFRLVHENLPKFLDNLSLYSKIIEKYPDLDFSIIETELEDVFQRIRVKELFSLDFFNECLTQTGIERYLIALGGRSEEGQKKIQGINEYVNLYRQQNQLKKTQLGNFSRLFKQILSDRESVSFIPESFKNDKEVLDSIHHFFNEELLNWHHNGASRSLFDALIDLFQHLDEADLNKVYVQNGTPLSSLSNQVCGDWSAIGDALREKYKRENPAGKRTNEIVHDEKAVEFIKKRKGYSIAELQNAITASKAGPSTAIVDYFKGFSKKNNQEEKEMLISKIDAAYKRIQKQVELSDKKTLRADKQKGGSVELIKEFLDSLIELLHFIKPLIPMDQGEKDDNFYGEFFAIFEQLNLVTPLYNKVRNYITQKPFSTEKYPLNFENPNFLAGWAIKNEISNSCLIFKEKDQELYYLGVLDKKSRSSFKNDVRPELDGDVFCKLEYSQVANPGMDVQNLMVIDGKTVKKNGRKQIGGEFDGQNIILEELKNKYLPEKINNIRKSSSYSITNENFNKGDLVSFIDYYKERVDEYYQSFNFEFLAADQYENMNSFTNHINDQAYQINFRAISRKYIDSLVNSGKLYLFQIYNKDFSEYSKGKPNLHTLYWKAMFDPQNLKNVVYKLNGEAEVFFRKKSISYTKEKWEKGHHHEKLKGKFNYPIIKDRRYALDKLQFHVPITMNFKASGGDYINADVNEYLKSHPDTHIIGIDRGERHLLYLTLIDSKGKIKRQMSLNDIISEYKAADGKNVKVVTAYRELLDTKEKERDEARKSWGSIEQIKDLKEGYLSQIVHQIAKMVVQYNAIVVLEDLNMGFKRGRQKVEKQVYQKFEKMLIDKLNYLVFKEKEMTEAGGILKAYQLTNKFQSFKKMSKQNGILFFVPAHFTSKIDPVTGFVSFFYNRYESVEKSVKFFRLFDSISYNKTKDWFEFDVDYNKFTERAKNSKSPWKLCSYGQRIETFRNPDKNNNWDSRSVGLTAAFKELLNAYGIDYMASDILSEIANQDSKEFHQPFMHLFRLMVQMRNSQSGTEVDYLQSPVAPFFNSEEQQLLGKTEDGSWKAPLPVDSDGNGAYNIARKGMWIMQRIKQAKKSDKVDLKMTNDDWLQFVQKLASNH